MISVETLMKSEGGDALFTQLDSAIDYYARCATTSSFVKEVLFVERHLVAVSVLFCASLLLSCTGYSVPIMVGILITVGIGVSTVLVNSSFHNRLSEQLMTPCSEGTSASVRDSNTMDELVSVLRETPVQLKSELDVSRLGSYIVWLAFCVIFSVGIACIAAFGFKEMSFNGVFAFDMWRDLSSIVFSFLSAGYCVGILWGVFGSFYE